MAEKRVSFKRGDMTEGGGLIGDVDVTFKEVGFTMFGYQNKGPEVPAFRILMTDAENTDHEQFWTVGSDWTPTKDGKGLVPLKGQTGINKGSNYGVFLEALFEAGFPEDKLEDDISILEGMQAHVIRIPEPKRNLTPRAPRPDGKVYDKTVLVVSEIHKLPWEKGGSGGGKAKGGDDASEKTMAAIMEILQENPKGMDKKKLASAIFAAHKNDPDRNEMMKLAYDDGFLGSGPWTFEKGVCKP